MENKLTIMKDTSYIRIEADLMMAYDFAMGFDIKNQDDKRTASDHIGALKSLKRDIEKRKLEMTAPMREAVKQFNDLVATVTDKADNALRLLEQKFIVYLKDEEKRERERIEAIQRAESERLRIEAEKAQAEIMEVAEELNSNDLVEQAIETHADLMERAAQVENNAVIVKSGVVRGVGYGTSLRDNWKCKVVDEKAFLEWVLKTERFELITPNYQALAVLAKMSKVEKIENGIQFVNEQTTATR